MIDKLSEDLLDRFTDLPLMEPYDVYQRLMDYWENAMQDDVYLISADGWVNAARPRAVIVDKDRKIKEAPDLTIKSNRYKMDLIPPGLVIARYFAVEQVEIERLAARHEKLANELEEFVEEHTSEGGYLEDVINDRGRITKMALNSRLNALPREDDPEGFVESKVLKRCLALIDAESKAADAVKAARTDLDQMVLERYGTLAETEVKTLVVEDKWKSNIRAEIEAEERRLTQHLSARILELTDRYAHPLPRVEREVEAYGEKVETHLKKMGLSWA